MSLRDRQTQTFKYKDWLRDLGSILVISIKRQFPVLDVWVQQQLNIVDSNHEIYTFMMLLQILEYFFYTPHQKVSTLQQTTIDFVSTSGSDPSSLYRLQHTFYSITIYHVGNMRIYTCIKYVTSGNGHCCSQKIGILTCRQIVSSILSILLQTRKHHRE